MNLGPRLKTIYNWIKQGANHVVDIGADHAFLSINLIKNNKVKSVSNIEINELPLQNGYKNVVNAQLTNKIKFYLNNGLKNLTLNPAPEYICISGMGADNIIEIISNNLTNQPHFYLLQANTDNDKLRKFLFTNFFTIKDEIIVYENDHYYELMMIEQSNVLVNFTLKDLYLGPILQTKPNDIFKQYLLEKYHYLSALPLEKINSNLKLEYQVIKDFLYEKKWIN